VTEFVPCVMATLGQSATRNTCARTQHPKGFTLAASLTPARLTLAAWLCVAIAVLEVPILGMELFLAAASDSADGPASVAAHAGSSILAAISSTICAVLFTTVRVFLEERFGFFKASSPIRLIVNAEGVLAVGSVLELFMPGYTLSHALVLLLFLFTCVVRIVAAIKMLSLPDDWGGLLKPYCIAEIVFGVCCATVVLLPIGLIAIMISDILLAIVFFRAADNLSAQVR